MYRSKLANVYGSWFICLFLDVVCRKHLGLAAGSATFFAFDFASLDGGREEDCGHGWLSFSGNAASTFASMRHSSAVLFIRDFSKFATDRV